MILPTAAPTIDRIGVALENLALAASNDTTVLQQLTAANLALTALVTLLTAANKKLTDAATSADGEDISVVFLHEATQSMAMAAQASSTPYNPQTLNLPSISALVSFYHACLGFLVKQSGWTPLKQASVTPSMVSHTPTWQDIVPAPT